MSTKAATAAAPIVFPCPSCHRFVTVDPSDRNSVRPLSARPGDPVIIHAECPVCRRDILRTCFPDHPAR